MSIKILENKVVVIASVVLCLILVFSIIGGMAGTIIDSSNNMQSPNNCSLGRDTTGVPLVINYSNNYCRNTTGSSLYAAAVTALPFANVTSTIGLLILMCLILILLIITIYKSVKAK